MYLTILGIGSSLLIALGLFNPSYLLKSRKFCFSVFIVLVDCLIGIIVAVWAIYDYYRGKYSNHQKFFMALPVIIGVNIVGISACVYFNIRIFLIILLCLLLFIQTYLWKKSNEARKIFQIKFFC